MTLKVMTFNLRSDCWFDGKNRWTHRKSQVETLLTEIDADFVGLQEVTLPMRQDLEFILTQYHWVGRPRTKRPRAEQNPLLISKRHIVLEEETFWLSKTPHRVGSSIWYSLFPRICTTAKVQLDTGDIIRVYNTHLDCVLSPARRYGLQKLMDYMEKQQAEESLPILLMGDFNTNPNSPLIQGILDQKWGSQPLVAVQEVDNTLYSQATMSGFKGRDKGFHLDYIFVSPHYHLHQTTIVKTHRKGRLPSDHYPLLAEVELQSSQSTSL